MLLQVGDFICGGRTCSMWQFHICLSEVRCLAFLVQWLVLSLFWAFLLCCSNIFSFSTTFFCFLLCMFVLQYLPSQKGGKRLLAYFPVDIWADAQVSQQRLWWKHTVCDALWESWHLTVSEVLAASASDISQSLLCHMLACYISIFSIIKENKQWMSAIGNRG